MIATGRRARGALRLPSLIAVAAFTALRPATAEEDPWRLLAAARTRLAAEPRSADFVQTYVPAGFTSGESESGSVAFALPERVRWDYVDPFPRSFLVVGTTVYAWSEGDAGGRRIDLDSAEARHLDLLRLDTGQLAERYVAERVNAEGEGSEVLLVPIAPDSDVREARIGLGPDAALTWLSYLDAEGNSTRFEFSAERPLHDLGRLAPPDLEWSEP